MIVSPWDGWRPATCMPDGCFCEHVRDGLIRQPANTWSCLAFVAVGLLVLHDTFAGRPDGGETRSDPFSASPTYGVLYGGALILIGLGSGFYHASLSFAGQFVDVFGMYLLGTFILLYNLSRLRSISDVAIASAYVGLNVLLAFLLYAVPELRRYAFGLLVVAALALELRTRRRGKTEAQSRLLWKALAAIGLGFGIWILDVTRILCAERSLLQGHAAWHVAGAAASWFLYRYYRSERAVGPLREG